jgi:hypothetical protein
MGRRRCTDTLPENPTWIDFKRSDGCSDRWPKNTSRKIKHARYIDVFRVVDLDEPGRSIKWRCDIGRGLANMMNLPSTYAIIVIQIKNLSNFVQSDHHTS